MARLNLLFLILVFLGSCKAWDPSMIGVTQDPISPKLLTLERRMEDMANTTVITNDDELKLFTEEVEENLIDPYGDKYGYIAYKSTILERKEGMAGAVLSGIFMGLPIVLGIPFSNVKYTVDIELRILDKNNKLLAKYSATGRSNVKIAMYHGYSTRDAFRKSYSDALTNAFDQIRPKIKADVDRVNDKLKEAGKLR